jgi:hypothetical protein
VRAFQSEDLYAVERLLPRCRTEVIAGQDHSVLVERHHELRPLLLDWIARHHEGRHGRIPVSGAPALCGEAGR